MLVAARKEAAEEAAVTEQRRLLEMVLAEGQVTFANAAVQLGVPRGRVEEHVRRLVGLEVFSGAVNWKTGVLYSSEARLLREGQVCVSCGARLELAGKGVIACDHCGAQSFLLT